MKKVSSDPELNVRRTRGAAELEPTLEETYAAAVKVFYHGIGALDDNDYVRKGNKAACARLAKCDTDTSHQASRQFNAS